MTVRDLTHRNLAQIVASLCEDGVPVRFSAYDGSHTGPDDAQIGLHLATPRGATYLATAAHDPELGLARAYVLGDLRIDGVHPGDPYPALRSLADGLVFRRPAPRELLALIRSLGWERLRPLPPPPHEALPRWRRLAAGISHSRHRDSEAIHRHYDVSNSFYERVLGDSMTYTCALYERSDDSLETAQQAKHQLVFDKLGLAPGMRLLDVGCGWGGMVRHAARRGVRALGVTLSAQQARWAQAAIDAEGLGELAQVRHLDYRDAPGRDYDAIASIGLTEHIGVRGYPAYFGWLHDRLRPGGRLLNHCITRPSNDPRVRTGAFIDRYVFPDGELIGSGRIISEAQDAGLEVRHEENLREHYALTLAAWCANLVAHWDACVAEVDESTARVWGLYMAGSRLAFERNEIQLHQVLAVRPDARGRSGVPLTTCGCARVVGMGHDIAALLDARTWRAFDIDDHGRVLAGCDESGSVQLVELDTDGTATPLTALPGPCSGRYLPGQRAVVVAHDDGGDERGQLSLLALDPVPDAPVGLDGLEPLVADPEHVHRLIDVLPGRVVYTSNRRNGVDFDVLIRAVDTAAAEEVVYDRGGMVQAVATSPEARHAVLTVPGVAALSDQLLLVDTMPQIEDDRVTELTDADTAARHVAPHWLAGGHTVVVSSDAGRDRCAVSTVDVRDGARRVLVESSEHDLVGWPSPDGRLLLVEANDDGSSRLALHDAASGRLLHRVALPAIGVVSAPLPDPVWSPDSRRVALSLSAPGVPGDVLVLDTADGSVRALTASAEPLPGLVEPSARRVPTPDGEQLPCFVYEPSTADSDVAGSAVLVLHGGPEGQSRRGFNPVVQGLAAAGHTVVVPNIRGSTGYGKRWYSADDGRRRLDSLGDLEAVHDWLPSLGIDPGRVALWGGSYGGYLVLAGLAFQPHRWAAGVDIVGISSLVTFLENTSAYRRAHREREYGSLASDRDFLEQASPLSRVDRIRAPLFVIHGANDPRVPLSEAEQLVDAVRTRGVTCELLVYPDEGHGLSKRANRKDAYPRALAFLAKAVAAG